MKVSKEAEKTVIKSLALGGLFGGGGPCMVDVKNGKIIRIRPFRYDWKYDKKQFNPWKFETRVTHSFTDTARGPLQRQIKKY